MITNRFQFFLQDPFPLIIYFGMINFYESFDGSSFITSVSKSKAPSIDLLSFSFSIYIISLFFSLIVALNLSPNFCSVSNYLLCLLISMSICIRSSLFFIKQVSLCVDVSSLAKKLILLSLLL